MGLCFYIGLKYPIPRAAVSGGIGEIVKIIYKACRPDNNPNNPDSLDNPDNPDEMTSSTDVNNPNKPNNYNKQKKKNKKKRKGNLNNPSRAWAGGALSDKDAALRKQEQEVHNP